jgi:type I restriction enzyme S subunit
MKNGWQTKPLGDILQLEYGKALEEKDRRPGGRFPVYGANGERDRTDKFYHDRPSIVVGRKGSAGEINLTERKFWPLDVTYFVTFDEQQYDLRFLYYLLKTLELPKLAKGVKPGINRTEVYSLLTRVPQLPEQRRIVAILDKTFIGIATAKANAEKNLQNARALFESHIQSVFTDRAPDWAQKQLGDVCELFQGLCINAKTKHLLVERSALPLLRIRDLRDNSTEQFVAESGWPPNARVTPSDIIYTRTGQIGLVFRGRTGVLHNNCFKIQAKPLLNKGYLFWWLQAPAFRACITRLASKAAQPDITHALFKAQAILVPPRAYQDQAISTIEQIHSETQHLVSIYERELAALDELRKSLLHWAFAGQL